MIDIQEVKNGIDNWAGESNTSDQFFKILDWLANGKTGLSSKSLAFETLGIEYSDRNHPRDPADLNRCLILIKIVPSCRAAVDALAKKSEGWKKAAIVWDEISQCFIGEAGLGWTTIHSAPMTYKMMKDAGL